MKNIIRFALTTGLALMVSLPTIAVPPQTLNYQGYLTNPGGTPVNTSVVMTFRLYNAASGGTALYTETQLSVNVSNGGFNAVIGTVTPIPLPFDVPYWLTVAVNSDAEMSPRQPLASSAYAFRAASLDTAATISGAQITGSISTATLPATQITGTINATTAATAAALTGNVSGAQITGAITSATIGGAQVSGPVASATMATSATTAASFSGPLGGDITGQQGSTTIAAIRGSAVSAVAPTDGQVLIFRGGQWQPAADVVNLLASFAALNATVNALNSPRIYVANNGSNTVSVINGTFVGSPFAVGSSPSGIALNPSGSRAYVANFSSNSVTVIDTASNTVVATIVVGSGPRAIAFNPGGSRAYVTNQYSSTVSVIDTGTNAVLMTGGTIMVGQSPVSIALNSSGSRAYVVNASSSNVTVIDTTTNPPSVLPIGGTFNVGTQPFAIALNPIGTRAYVTQSSNDVSVYDITNTPATFVTSIPAGMDPRGIAINPSGTRAYVANFGSNNVTVIDTNPAISTNVVATIIVGSNPQGIALNPSGSRAYVVNNGSNNVTVIDTATNTVVGAPIAVGASPIAIAVK